MMNMMDRFVDGRAHVREIDMLLELTYVLISLFFAPRFPLFGSIRCTHTCCIENKSRAEQFVH